MADRAIRILLQAGVIAVVIAALPYKLFELDRYFVPKELVLHSVALIVAAILVARRRLNHLDFADSLLALFLVWSVFSALFATNYWLAQRALGVSISGAIVFWGARSVSASGSCRPILAACAVAAVLAAAASLAQAYGLHTEYFSANRAPGGTFGNRNFVAHIAVIGLPALVWCAVTARRPVAALAGSFGVALVSAVLILSRSRAAWLALAASAIMLLLPMLASRKYWRGRDVGGRFSRLVLAAVIGAIIAIVLPNDLNWNSDSPYLDSARAVVDYKKGSGRGRVAQYENSLRMALANPVFGVGPGNWPVKYVEYAPADDRSIVDDGMTANPWPSSDWVAFVSERGLVPAVALLGVFAVLFFRALRRWGDLDDGDAVLAQLVLAGTIVTTMVVSAFDVALLLAAPAFLVWSVLGAATGIRDRRRGTSDLGDQGYVEAGVRDHRRSKRLAPRAWRVAVAVLILLVAIAVTRSATQIASMATVGRGGLTSAWVAGAAWDRGSYRINVRVAEFYSRRGRCTTARSYARRASGLFPHSLEARRIARSCE